jgi:Bacterial CdiA-CT RNAse A domain
MQSVLVPPSVLGDADGLRLAAVRLEGAAVDIDWTVINLRNTVLQLTAGGDWTGPAADAFAQRMVEPVCMTMSGVARELERIAGGVRRGATAIEEAQSEYRQAEATAIAAGVLVGLGVLTFAITDAAAADAADAAAGMMTRAAAAAATGMRAVTSAMDEVEAAIGSLNGRLATGMLSAAATAPTLMEGPVAAGLFGALSTAAMGDLSPADWAQAMALGYLESRAGDLAGEAEEPVVPGFTKAGVPRLYSYDLERLEGVDRAHVMAVHCEETAPQLSDRLRFDPKVRASSTFRNRSTAQRAIQDAIDSRQDDITTWLAAGSPKQFPLFEYAADDVVGTVLTRAAWERGHTPVGTNRLLVLLRRSSASPTGFVVYTAYPVPEK